MKIVIIIMIMMKIIVLIKLIENNKSKREESKRSRCENEIMDKCSTITYQMLSYHTNPLLSANMLYKTKIQYYLLGLVIIRK